MAREQYRSVSKPIPSDADFTDFSALIQDNLVQLFQDSHTHLPTTTTPGSGDGQVGDIKVVNLSGTYYLYAKVDKTTWKRVLLS